MESVLQDYVEAKRSDIRKSAAAESPPFAAELEGAINSLERAQAAWISYRDAHCDMVEELYLNGTGKAAGGAQCVIDLTKLRIRELWVRGSGLPEPN
jgi:uncharacterized protein YecT (DUF1311 family)